MRRVFGSLLILSLLLAVTVCGSGRGSSSHPPATPQNLAATATGLQIDLSWNAVSAVDGYRVEWHDDTTIAWSELTTVTSTSYSHSGLSNGTTYSYRVVATQGCLESTPSAAVSADTPPVAPQNLAATATGLQIELTWDAVNGVDGYRVEWHDDTTTTWTALTTVTSTSYSHTGLIYGVTYRYRIIATQGSLESSPSVEAATRVVPVAPAYVRSSISHAAINDNPLTLSWPAVTDATLYRVYYSTTKGVTTADPFLETTATSLSVSAAANFGILDGERYYFGVAGVNIDIVGSLSSEIAVAATPKWDMISPGHGGHNPAGNVTEAIAYDGGGIYLYVGADGLISRSTDGISWQLQHAGVDGYDLRNVTWTGSRFVVVGADAASTNGIVLTSSDGISWTATHGVMSGGIKALASNGSRLFAVGYGTAAYSDDQGDSWIAITSMSGANVNVSYLDELQPHGLK